MLREINRLRDETAPEPELAMQRQYLTGNYLLSLESPLRTAERVQNIDLYSLPADYYKSYARRISETPASRVRELAGKYLDPRQMSIIVVGEASEILPALKQLGPVQVYDLDLQPIAGQSQ
jgi:predicted Zn-dependent peptidase